MQKKLYKAIQLRESHLYNLSFGVRDGKSHISKLSNFNDINQIYKELKFDYPHNNRLQHQTLSLQ